MKFLKIEKGCFNYIKKRRLYEIIKTVILFAFAIGLYLLGYITLKTNKSLWSIFAVLSVLPAAKSCVLMIMCMRFSSLSQDEFDEISDKACKVNTLYELVFTTRDKSYYIKALSCADNTIIALYDGSRDKNAEASVRELKEHIDATLKRDGINNCSIKIYVKLADYTKRLSEMNLKLSADESCASVFHTIKAVVL